MKTSQAQNQFPRNRSANLVASLMWFVKSTAIVGHVACLESSPVQLSSIK